LEEYACGYVEEQDKRMSYYVLTNPFLALPEFYIRFDAQCARLETAVGVLLTAVCRTPAPAAAEEIERMQLRLADVVRRSGASCSIAS
jgi:hypothetical protein